MTDAASQLAYRDFCCRPDVPLYAQPVWLDAAHGSAAWDATLLRDEAGNVQAALPLPRLQKGPFAMIDQPRGTHYLGPVWADAFTPTQQANSLASLIAQLPPVDYFYMALPPGVEALPFAAQGYELLAKYTHHLPLTRTLEQLWAGLKPSLRTQVRKAQRQLSIRPATDFTAFYQMSVDSMQRQGATQLMAADVFCGLFQALPGQLVAWEAVDAQQQVHARMALLLEPTRASVWTSAHDARLRAGAGSSLLHWHAVQTAWERGVQLLDFEGSMHPGIARFYRTFGAHTVPFVAVRKVSHPLLRWWRFLRAQCH